MSEAWQSPRAKEEMVRHRRRDSFEQLMSQVDNGTLTLAEALGVLAALETIGPVEVIEVQHGGGDE